MDKYNEDSAIKAHDELSYEIKFLQKRSEVLDNILAYYNSETKTFDIPAKWKSNNVRKDKLPAPTPRDWIYNLLKEVDWQDYPSLNQ